MTLKKNNGFTLVEMLVVIAIISVLAAALFPAINGALSQAQATALKNKGRGIWTAITSANMEREPLNKSPLWPADVQNDKSSVNSAASYFTYLLSDGSDVNTTTTDTDLRVVSDLAPESLIANGVTAAQAGQAIKDENIAWGIVVISDTDQAEMPFLISRNFDSMTTLQRATDESDDTRYTLNADIKPFGSNRAVWVTRGGGIYDARAKYFTKAQVMGVASDTSKSWDYWAVQSNN